MPAFPVLGSFPQVCCEQQHLCLGSILDFRETGIEESVGQRGLDGAPGFSLALPGAVGHCCSSESFLEPPLILFVAGSLAYQLLNALPV